MVVARGGEGGGEEGLVGVGLRGGCGEGGGEGVAGGGGGGC